MRFGVFGDGPYNTDEAERYRQVLGEINSAQPDWLIHVGDLIGARCSDEVLRARHTELAGLQTAVVYIPGDNEWTDCYRESRGGYQPLERLQALRTLFFATPGQTLGTRPFGVTTQASDSLFAEFVEHVSWRRGRVLFATLHLIGSDNGTEKYKGRTAADDSAATRRTDAALAWMTRAFAEATRDSLRAVVLAIHGDPGFGQSDGSRRGYASFVATLQAEVPRFGGEVVVIHGDTHEFRVDHPMRGPDGATVERLTRIETYGSPDIGWVMVDIDTTTGALVKVTPRETSRLRLH